MKTAYPAAILPVVIILGLISCRTLEQASQHGFTSGYYQIVNKPKKPQNVYADVREEQINVHHQHKKQPEKKAFMVIPLTPTDSLLAQPVTFKKNSLDVDITTILLKHRPSVNGSAAQVTTDFNLALYAGWRHDQYTVTTRKDPLGQRYLKVMDRGYDFGLLAGAGTTPINPFVTNNRRSDEYSAMVIQIGLAGFIETQVASFGLSTGVDYLLNRDRTVWIYQQQPWVGFVVGVALN